MARYSPNTLSIKAYKNPCLGNVLYEHQYIKLAREYQMYHPYQAGSSTEGKFGDRRYGVTGHYQTVFNGGIQAGWINVDPRLHCKPEVSQMSTETSQNRMNCDPYNHMLWDGSTRSVATYSRSAIREYFPITVALYKPYIEAIQAGQVWDDDDPIGFVAAIKYETLDNLTDFNASIYETRLTLSIRDLWNPDSGSEVQWSSLREDYILQQNTYECLYYANRNITAEDWPSFASHIKGIGGLYGFADANVNDAVAGSFSALAYGPETGQSAGTAGSTFFCPKSFEQQNVISNWYQAGRLSSSNQDISSGYAYVKDWLVNHAAPGYPGGFEGLMDLILASYMNKTIAGEGHSITGDINQNSESIGTISDNITNMQTVIDSIDGTVSDMNQSITSITESISAIGSTIESIQHSIRTISDRVTACEVAIQELQPGEGGSTFTLI